MKLRVNDIFRTKTRGYAIIKPYGVIPFSGADHVLSSLDDVEYGTVGVDYLTSFVVPKELIRGH